MLRRFSIAKSLQPEITAFSPDFIELITEFKNKGQDYASKIELRRMGDERFNLDTTFLYTIGVQDLIERYLQVNNKFKYLNEKQENAHGLLKTTKYCEFPDAKFFLDLGSSIK